MICATEQMWGHGIRMVSGIQGQTCYNLTKCIKCRRDNDVQNRSIRCGTTNVSLKCVLGFSQHISVGVYLFMCEYYISVCIFCLFLIWNYNYSQSWTHQILKLLDKQIKFSFCFWLFVYFYIIQIVIILFGWAPPYIEPFKDKRLTLVTPICKRVINQHKFGKRHP